MSVDISFSPTKRRFKSSNDNIHDQSLWNLAYRIAENTKPLNEWPHQFAVHYLYEILNRPWLPPEIANMEAVRWIRRSMHPEEELYFSVGSY